MHNTVMYTAAFQCCVQYTEMKSDTTKTPGRNANIVFGWKAADGIEVHTYN